MKHFVHMPSKHYSFINSGNGNTVFVKHCCFHYAYLLIYHFNHFSHNCNFSFVHNSGPNYFLDNTSYYALVNNISLYEILVKAIEYTPSFERKNPSVFMSVKNQGVHTVKKAVCSNKSRLHLNWIQLSLIIRK